MKKRYILFGYQIQNGEFCIVQQEGAAVEYIFDAYSNGDSLQQIATHMSSCEPPYRSSDNRWNKNHCPIAFLRHLLRYSNLSRHYHKRTVFPSTATSQ